MAAASCKLFGVEILDEGFGSSVYDSVLEMQATFVTRPFGVAIDDKLESTRGCVWTESNLPSRLCRISPARRRAGASDLPVALQRTGVASAVAESDQLEDVVPNTSSENAKHIMEWEEWIYGKSNLISGIGVTTDVMKKRRVRIWFLLSARAQLGFCSKLGRSPVRPLIHPSPGPKLTRAAY